MKKKLFLVQENLKFWRSNLKKFTDVQKRKCELLFELQSQIEQYKSIKI